MRSKRHLTVEKHFSRSSLTYRLGSTVPFAASFNQQAVLNPYFDRKKTSCFVEVQDFKSRRGPSCKKWTCG